MTVEDLCKKYKQKMWLSMIARLKLSIDPWELVKYTGSSVYASSGMIGREEYIIDTDKCLECGTPLRLHSTKNIFFVSKKCNCFADGSFSWTNNKLGCLISSKEKVNSLISSINDKKTAKFPGRTRYWIDQGCSQEESVLKVQEWQSLQSAKSCASKPGTRSHSVRCKEYYIKQGFTEEEANISVREIQVTNGLNWYVKKYGQELGESLYNDRIDRWLSTYYSKIDINEINKSKGRTKKEMVEKNGLEWYNEFELSKRAKIIKTKIEKGYYSLPELKAEKIIYLEKVSFFTRYSLRNHFYLINPTNEPIGIREHHIDHLFSKNQGFIQEIPPEIIGNPLNLRAIYWKDNLSKGSLCYLTKEQLYENYEKSKITHRYPY